MKITTLAFVMFLLSAAMALGSGPAWLAIFFVGNALAWFVVGVAWVEEVLGRP